MNIRKLIKVNLINIAILALVMLFKMFTGMLFDAHDKANTELSTLSIVLSVIFLFLWAAFTIYSNVTVVKEDKYEKKRNITEVRNRLMKAGKKNIFSKERTVMLNMLDSLASREKYFSSMDKDSKLPELFELTENQMIRNATNVAEYMETFDYISGKDSGYVRRICDESQHLLDKFNKLVELTVTYDDTSRDYDTREIDDMIEALELMRNSGKGALGS
ncbi:MAG: hypothetical protein J6M65_07370 [Eubacterium sp.]|nr:hypothetical protein [Eubacterium sp.]